MQTQITVNIAGLEPLIEALDRIGAHLENASSQAAPAPKAQAPVAERKQNDENIAESKYTADDILEMFKAKRMASKSRETTRGLKNILDHVGAASVSEIKPEDYDVVVQSLELLP